MISPTPARSVLQPLRQLQRTFLISKPRVQHYAFRPSCHTRGLRTSTKAVQSQFPASRVALIVGAGIFSCAAGIYFAPRTSFDAPAVFSSFDSHFEQQDDSHDFSNPPEPSNLPKYRLSEIRKHDGDSAHPWVIYGDKVYDITEWVPAHPGGKVILRAAGGSIDSYWDIFSIHKTQYVYDILSQYHIGYVHPADLEDGRPPQEAIEDPFSADPVRDPALITLTAKPCNAETPNEAMNAQFLTPNEHFYVRNHMWVPTLATDAAQEHRLTIELIDGSTKEYSLKDLQTKFPKRQITAALQCSGNRRKHMTNGSGRSTNGLQWNAGAISNATWEGVYLADVLADAGFSTNDAMSGAGETKHVQFSGMEAYGASIPIKKAIDPQGDVLLAYGMNGKPLPRDHGFPLRSIVPGHVAARSVKWLNQITLSDEESTSQWQRKDYKCFGPNETEVDWDNAPAIQELPVQSAITSIQLGNWTSTPLPKTQTKEDKPSESEVPAQKVSLGGYAFSGGGRSIIRVDVSLDNGQHWTQATLLPDCVEGDGTPSPCQGHAAWSWKRWQLDDAVPLSTFRNPSSDNAENLNDKDSGVISTEQEQATAQQSASSSNTSSKTRCTTVMVKATDDGYNTQPDSHSAIWNIRGNLANAWHRVQVCTDCGAAEQGRNRKQA